MITVNNAAWATSVNVASLSGAGLGMNWSNKSGWNAKIAADRRLGAESSLITDTKRMRGWAEIGAWF